MITTTSWALIGLRTLSMVVSINSTTRWLAGKLNNPKQGLGELEKVLQELKIKNKEQALFCLEHTGIYNHTLVAWIAQQGYHLGLESP